jgi:hypothetical protein
MNPDRLGRVQRKFKYIDVQQSGSILGAGGVSVSTGVGDMVTAEIGSLSKVSLVITAGDEHDFFMRLPRDMNVLHPMGVRIFFTTASTTGADTHTWITLYGVIDEDAAWALGTTAMDTTHVVATDVDSGVANGWQKSTRAIIDGATFTRTQVVARSLLAFNLELDATDASEAIHLDGIEVDYVPKRYVGPDWTWNPNVDDI